jgi:hypothetical protein
MPRQRQRLSRSSCGSKRINSGIRLSPEPCKVAHDASRARADRDARLRPFFPGQKHLGIIVSSEVRRVCLRRRRCRLAQLDDAQRSPTQRPLIPLVAVVDVLIHKMHGGLSAGVRELDARATETSHGWSCNGFNASASARLPTSSGSWYGGTSSSQSRRDGRRCSSKVAIVLDQHWQRGFGESCRSTEQLQSRWAGLCERNKTSVPPILPCVQSHTHTHTPAAGARARGAAAP